MKSLLFVLALALSLTGCASNDYALYADSQARVETARHQADAAKYRAMADIAASGTEAAKVAAVMAMTLGQGGATQATRLQAPQASEALQWASILVPSLTQVAGIAANARVAVAQSNNAARVAESTNGTLMGIASKIQAPIAPAANVSTVNTTTSNTTSSTTNDRHDSIQTTLSGTGTLGGGAYSTAANPITTNDRHDVYTPAPVVVTPVVTVEPTVITPVVQVQPTVVVPVTPTVPVVVVPVTPIVPVVVTPTAAPAAP